MGDSTLRTLHSETKINILNPNLNVKMFNKGVQTYLENTTLMIPQLSRILACLLSHKMAVPINNSRRVKWSGTLSIDDEMGQRRRPEVKFSRANLLGMRKGVKTSSSLRRRRNSGRFAVVAKT